ncbi:MAG: ABC transporter permease [Bacilli bacterium]|nr:ABC transporter permease [Bacilli bacterium]
MKNKLKLLVKDGLRKKLNTKWFKIVNIILLLAIPILLNIDSVIEVFGGDFKDPITVYIIDDTNILYKDIKESYETTGIGIGEKEVEIKEADKSIDKLKKEMLKEETNDIILKLQKTDGIITAEMTSFEYVDAITLQLLTNAINNAKTKIALSESDIDKEELAKIQAPVDITRIYLNDELDENYEFIKYLSTMLIPVFIVPFFFLIIMVIQMIGAEINEEKSSKSMEIIITSVSPKIHFISKMITSNLYAIVQALLFVVYFIIGLFIRTKISGLNLTESFGDNISGMIKTFMESGMLNDILRAVPWVIIMLVLSFIAYSLLAGILASMTTNQEDFSQLQTPLMILIMVGYYIALMASTYEKSTFIIILSVIPFLSSIIAPVLLIIGQIGIVEILISILMLILTIFLLLKYGLRIYKVGILNYSSEGLWKKMWKSMKSKD